MLLSLSSYGMYKLELRDDVSGGYTAYDARSRYEAQVAREFYGAIDDPMMTSVLILAKDGGTMHRREYLDEAYYIVKSIQNITMKYGERRLIYDKMCEPHCFGDEVFSIFKMIVVSLYGNKDTKKKAGDFLLWELAAYEYSHQYNEGLYTDGSLVEFLVC
nr:Patched domain containing protein [Haemonchus contortus]